MGNPADDVNSQRCYDDGYRGVPPPLISGGGYDYEAYNAGRNDRAKWSFLEPKPKKKPRVFYQPAETDSSYVFAPRYSKVEEWADNLEDMFPLSILRALGERLSESGWIVRFVFAGIGGLVAIPLNVFWAIGAVVGFVFPFVTGKAILGSTRIAAFTLALTAYILRIAVVLGVVGGLIYVGYRLTQ